MNGIMKEVISEREGLWQEMADTMTCGKCGCGISRHSEYSCKLCGRMLCDNCGTRWELCKDHLPKCYHPNLRPAMWNQPKPEPVIVTGQCQHNYICSVCGFGRATTLCGCIATSRFTTGSYGFNDFGSS